MARRDRSLEPPLTAEELRKILDYDSETGIFRWRTRPELLPRWSTRYAGKIAGFPAAKGHLFIQINGKNHMAHRLAWLYVHGTWPPDQIDHINRVPDDNRIANLRPATHAENCLNRSIQSNNTSGYAGVSFEKQRGKWRVRINRNGRTHFDEFFDTPEEAAQARDAAIRSIHGEFARLSHE